MDTVFRARAVTVAVLVSMLPLELLGSVRTPHAPTLRATVAGLATSSRDRTEHVAAESHGPRVVGGIHAAAPGASVPSAEDRAPLGGPPH